MTKDTSSASHPVGSGKEGGSGAVAPPIDQGQAAPAATGDWLDKGFECFGRAEWFAVFGTGHFAFRFGPFTGPEVGQIMTRAVAEKIAVTIVANCGAPVDWDLASQFKIAEAGG